MMGEVLITETGCKKKDGDAFCERGRRDPGKWGRSTRGTGADCATRCHLHREHDRRLPVWDVTIFISVIIDYIRPN